MLFIVKSTLSYWCVEEGTRRYSFDCKKHCIFDENRSQNRMKNMSKNILIFILCCKCIIWCWQAWRVCGNVSGVLQTRKTVKNASCFGQIDYNRILNTNAHRLMCIMSAAFRGAPKHRTQNDLTSRLFTFRIITWNPEIYPRSFLCSFNGNTSFGGDVRQHLARGRVVNS